MKKKLNSIQLKKIISDIIKEQKSEEPEDFQQKAKKIGSEIARAPAEIGEIIRDDTVDLSRRLVNVVLINLKLLSNKVDDLVDYCPVNFIAFSELIAFFVAIEGLYQIRRRLDDFKKIESAVEALEKKISDSDSFENKKELNDIKKQLEVEEKKAREIIQEIDGQLEQLANDTPDGELKSELDRVKAEIKKETAAEEVMTDKDRAQKAAKEAADSKMASILKKFAFLRGKKAFIMGMLTGTIGYAAHKFVFQTETLLGDPKKGLGQLAGAFGIGGEAIDFKSAFNILIGAACFGTQTSILAGLSARYLRKGSGIGPKGTIPRLPPLQKLIGSGQSKKEIKTLYAKLAKEFSKDGIPSITKRLEGPLNAKLSDSLKDKGLFSRLVPVKNEITSKFLNEDPEGLIRTLTSSDSPLAKRFMQTLNNPLGGGELTAQIKADFLNQIFKSEINVLYRMSLDALEAGKPISIKTLSDPRAFPMLSQVDSKSQGQIINFIRQYNTELLGKLSKEADDILRKLYRQNLIDLNKGVLERSFNFSKKEIINGVKKGSDDLTKVYGDVVKMRTPDEAAEALSKLLTFKTRMKDNYGPYLVDLNIPIPPEAAGLSKGTISSAKKFKDRYKKAIDLATKKIQRSGFSDRDKEELLNTLEAIIDSPVRRDPTPPPPPGSRGRNTPPPAPRGARIKDRKTVDDDIIDIKEVNKIMEIDKGKLKNIVKQVLNEKNKSFYPYQEPEGETDERDISLEYKQILDDMEADPGVEIAVSLAKCLVKDQELFSVIMQMVKENPDVMERFVKLFRQQKQKAV